MAPATTQTLQLKKYVVTQQRLANKESVRLNLLKSNRLKLQKWRWLSITKQLAVTLPLHKPKLKSNSKLVVWSRKQV